MALYATTAQDWVLIPLESQARRRRDEGQRTRADPRHAQRLKMSHQEIEQEHKELEGNQEIKAKIKIPAALFAAVAQVLAYVYQLRAALAGQIAMPADLPELNVPADLDPHNKPVSDMEVFD